MISLLIYDIPDDKLRAKVADICLDYGLERIQFSAFLGKLDHNRQEEILLKLKRQVGEDQANIQLYPICDKDLRLRKTVEVVGKAGRGRPPCLPEDGERLRENSLQ